PGLRHGRWKSWRSFASAMQLLLASRKTDAPFATCEATMTSNPLVDFLASYGPQASSNNLYDEFVVEAAKRTGCAALQIDQPLTAELVAMLRSETPRCVILTGTAGDGKTYTARKVAEALTGEARVWSNTQKIYALPKPLPSGQLV